MVAALPEKRLACRPVLSCHAAAGALAIFEEQGGEFNLALCSPALPDRDVVEMLDAMRLRNPDLAVLFSSSFGVDEAGLARLREKGFAFARAPFSRTDILRDMKDALKRSRRRPGSKEGQ